MDSPEPNDHGPRRPISGRKQKMSLTPGPTPLTTLLILSAVLGLFANWLIVRARPVETVTYSEAKRRIDADLVKRVELSPSRLGGELKKDTPGQAKLFEAARVEDPDLVRELQSHGIEISGTEDAGGLGKLLAQLLPFALPLFLVWLLLRTMRAGSGSGMGSVLQAGQSKARVYMEKDIPVRFTDVAGVDEAKQELAEVVEFLKTPEKFARLGGHVPKGVLLVGPPGTGKTLLARAVAGQAGVPFFSISGSEFVEMFVGVGAARVRDLFARAKTAAPCIIFIDELDALGKVRGAGPMAHEEREQTLNQLLVELDGFDPRVGVILMAATNRPEILDPALLRAGRFDRQVLVDRPDKSGRLAILELHARKVRLRDPADLEALASMTAGMSGAELANIINEAALLAARRARDDIGREELTEAVERVVAGLEKKSRVLKPEEKARVAHHEVGHALVGLAFPSLGALQKISVIPRGVAALGYTIQVPTEDRFLLTQSELEHKIASLLGGRAAEELIYGEVSTGAQDDLEKATRIARSMVESYGMSEAIGLATLESAPPPRLLGLEDSGHMLSPEVARQIDAEVRRILQEQHDSALRVLREFEPLLRDAAQRLLTQETLSGDELRKMVDEFRGQMGSTALTH